MTIVKILKSRFPVVECKVSGVRNTQPYVLRSYDTIHTEYEKIMTTFK